MGQWSSIRIHGMGHKNKVERGQSSFMPWNKHKTPIKHKHLDQTQFDVGTKRPFTMIYTMPTI